MCRWVLWKQGRLSWALLVRGLHWSQAGYTPERPEAQAVWDIMTTQQKFSSPAWRWCDFYIACMLVYSAVPMREYMRQWPQACSCLLLHGSSQLGMHVMGSISHWIRMATAVKELPSDVARKKMNGTINCAVKFTCSPTPANGTRMILRLLNCVFRRFNPRNSFGLSELLLCVMMSGSAATICKYEFQIHDLTLVFRTVQRRVCLFWDYILIFTETMFLSEATWVLNMQWTSATSYHTARSFISCLLLCLLFCLMLLGGRPCWLCQHIYRQMKNPHSSKKVACD